MRTLTDAVTAAQECANKQSCVYLVFVDEGEHYTVIPARFYEGYVSANPRENLVVTTSPKRH